MRSEKQSAQLVTDPGVGSGALFGCSEFGRGLDIESVLTYDSLNAASTSFRGCCSRRSLSMVASTVREIAAGPIRNGSATANTAASLTTFACDCPSFELALHILELNLTAARVMPNVKD